MSGPNREIYPSERPCVYCGATELHWCGDNPPTAPELTEMEMDRNWWKATADKYKRELDALRRAHNPIRPPAL